MGNKKDIDLFLNKIKELPDFDKVKFVFLYGSVAEKKENKFSDIDFAVYFDGNKKERFDFRLKLMAKLSENFDVKIFQDLPLNVRMNVLKGRLVYVKNAGRGFVYDVVYETIKRFEDFKRYYYDYIKRRQTVE